MNPNGPQFQKEWLQAQHDNRCLQISGDSMAPIVADGASVAYSSKDEDPLPARRQACGRLDRESADRAMVSALWPICTSPRRECQQRSSTDADRPR